MKKHIITEEEYQSVKEAAKGNKLKRVDKRLQVIILRYEGLTDEEIGEKLGYSRKRVSQLCAAFKSAGLGEYARHKYGGNHRAMNVDEEAELLEEFKNRAVRGEVVSAQEIKAAFDKRRGKDTGRGYIYMLLERHGWRTVMPRGRHPQKASDAVIETSKKLTLESGN